MFIAASHHLVPGIETKGRTDRQGPRRVAYAKKQIVAAGELAHPAQPERADPVPDRRGLERRRPQGRPRPHRRLPLRDAAEVRAVLQLAGARLPDRDGTHGNRLIDGIFSTTRTVAPVRQQILDHYGSDHRAVLVQYTNRSRSAVRHAQHRHGRAGRFRARHDHRPVVASRVATMTLQGEQVSNAAVIIAEGKKANIPTFGWVVAIATALQESGLRNLDHGDRDSQGLFQQRPSSGWGTVAQIRDPHLAAQAFYGVAAHTHNPGLVDITGWQSMSVAAAAQAVQISAFPGAYAKWEAAAGRSCSSSATARRLHHHAAAVRHRPGRAAGGLPGDRLAGGEGSDPGCAAGAALRQGEVPEPHRLRRSTSRPAARPSLRPGGRHHDPQLPHG